MKKTIVIFVLNLLFGIQQVYCQCYADLRNEINSVATTNQCPPGSGSELAKRLSTINIVNNQNVQLYIIEKKVLNGSHVYTAYTKKSVPIYTGKDYNALIQSLHEAYATTKNDVYLDLVNFTPTEEANLQSTCSVKLSTQNKDVRVNTLNRQNISIEQQDCYFLKTKNISDIELGEVVSKTTKTGKKYFSSTITFFKDAKRTIFTIISDYKTVITDFIAVFKTKLTSVFSRARSLADIVSDTKSLIQKKHGITSKQLLVCFKSELSNNMLVNQTVLVNALTKT